MNALNKKKNQRSFLGWRDENYEVMTVTNVSMMEMDRSATCLFGIRNFGVEINGYIRHPQKGLCIWLQQRSSMYYSHIFMYKKIYQFEFYLRHQADMAE